MNERFLIRNYKGQKEVVQYFLMLQEKNYQPRFLYLVKISFRNEGKIYIFSDKRKQQGFFHQETYPKIMLIRI